MSAASAQDINNDTQITYYNNVSTTQPILGEDDEASLAENNELADVLLEDSSQGGFSDLQDIINGAQEGSVISLDKDYKSTQSSAIKLDKSLTIDGQGYTLDCDNKCGALESNSGQITLKNLIIKNGHKNQGSAIFISGSARYTLINCIFKNGDGIAVYNNAEHGSLSITCSEFDGNRLGAVYSKGVVYVEDSEFTSNVATRGGAIDC
jgi:hypothetical protein